MTVPGHCSCRLLDSFEGFEFAVEAESIAGLGFDGGGPVGGHFMERFKDVVRRESRWTIRAHRKAGADTASGLGDLIVAGAGNSLFEIDETRRGENRMGMGIDEAGKDEFAGAVDFFDPG